MLLGKEGWKVMVCVLGGFSQNVGDFWPLEPAMKTSELPGRRSNQVEAELKTFQELAPALLPMGTPLTHG